MEIYNNDDCDINVINNLDIALELTKIYYSYRENISIYQRDILSTYMYFKEGLEEEGEE